MTCFINCLSDARREDVIATADGGAQVRFAAGPGLYQFSLILDAREVDWESLYVNLELFHNQGARTGPWDFDLLHQNEPLVPSYWVSLDGRPLGLWYMQRVSLADLAAKRFRGRLACYVGQAGEHTLGFRPYRATPVHWLDARLEADPEDTLDPRRFDLTDWPARCPAARWAAPAFWASLRQALEGSHALWRPGVERLFAWLRRKTTPEAQRNAPPGTYGFSSGFGGYLPDDLLPLIAEYHLTGRAASLAEALRAVDDAIAMPHWGNPREGAYGCDGDMGAAHFLRGLAWAWHALGPHLGLDRRERLREKLRLQGNRFFDQGLLHRDYWGGSVIQDHGKISLASFGAAAIHLLGVVPEAARWTAYVIPRVARSLAAMPRDGHIPPSSYHSPILYLDTPTYYRDALLALTGEDIFDQPQFRAVVDFLAGTADGEDADRQPGPGGSVGAAHFLNYLATKYRDGRAAWLARQRALLPEFKFGHGTQETGYYHGQLWGLLTHDPSVTPTPPTPGPVLRHFPDSGVVHYRDPDVHLELSLQCGPWCGHHAYRHATGPCDRMEMLQGGGHFTLSLAGAPRLVTPDAGYRLRWHTRNVLLIADEGLQGDVGYPMSIPSFPDRGEELAAVRWDAAARHGYVRLELTPAYAPHLDLALYTREFLIEQGRRIVVRDHVVLGSPRPLAWHFHGLRGEVRLTGPLTGAFGGESPLLLTARPADVALAATVQPTEVVYSYASAFHSFDHVRFVTVEPVLAATVSFSFAPSPAK